MDRLVHATFRAEREHFWFRGFRRFVRPLVDQAIGPRRDATILDCGCGTGYNLTWLGDYGRAFGIDLASVGVEYARSLGQRRVARASVTAVPFPAAAFDLVTSFDVLYSLADEDERRAVREMWRLVRPGGAILVNVAAMDVLRGNHSVLSHERRRYSRQRLQALLESPGFRIERITYTHAVLFPVLLGLRALQRLKGLAAEEDAEREIAVPSRPVNAALGALLAVEAGLGRSIPMPFGSSLLCLARKPVREAGVRDR